MVEPPYVAYLQPQDTVETSSQLCNAQRLARGVGEWETGHTAQCCDSVTCRLTAAWHEVGIGLHACTRAEVWLNLHFAGASCVLAEKVEALKIVNLVFCLQVMQDNNACEWVR